MWYNKENSLQQFKYYFLKIHLIKDDNTEKKKNKIVILVILKNV